MEMLYFSFIDTHHSIKSSGCLRVILQKLILKIIPNANPDFSGRYDDVHKWYIEYDEIDNYTSREIGVDANNNVIAIAPYKNNLGVWTDEELKLNEYKKFNINYIDKVLFENLWVKFSL